MTQLSPLAHTILERLPPQLKEYRYPLVASELGTQARDWLEAVRSLVKWQYAEAHNINRDVVAVRQTISPYPILYAANNERVYIRNVIGSELRPLWVKEVNEQVVSHYVAVVDPETLAFLQLVTAVAYTRYEDTWIMEVIPVIAEVAAAQLAG